MISLSTIHCSVKAGNMKTDPPTVSKLIFADERRFKTISSSNMVANLCGVHLEYMQRKSIEQDPSKHLSFMYASSV